MPNERPAEKHELAKHDDEIKALDKIIEEYSLENLTAGEPGSLSLTLKMAEGIEALENALTPAIMEKIMRLKNTTLGFKTDEREAIPAKYGKPPKPAIHYGVVVVKRCTIEALLSGLRMVGNEINIISGNTYPAKAGLGRLIREYKGFTDLVIKTPVPRIVGDKNDKGAIVTFEASWKLNGQADGIDGEIPIRVNYGMGSDAILGKADRKINYRILKHLSGARLMLADGDVESLDDMREADAEIKTLKAGRRDFGKKKEEPAENKARESDAEAQTESEPTPTTPENDWAEGEQERIELGELLKAAGLTTKAKAHTRVNEILQAYALDPVESSKDMDVETLNIVIGELKSSVSRTKMHRKLMAQFKGVEREERLRRINEIFKSNNSLVVIDSTKELTENDYKLLLDALDDMATPSEPAKETNPKSDLFK